MKRNQIILGLLVAATMLCAAVAALAMSILAATPAAAWSNALAVSVTSTCSGGALSAAATVQGVEGTTGYGLAVLTTSGATPGGDDGAATFTIDANGGSQGMSWTFPSSEAGEQFTVIVAVDGWYSDSSLTTLVDSGSYTYEGSVTLSSPCTAPTTTTTVPPTTTTTSPPGTTTTTAPTTPTTVSDTPTTTVPPVVTPPEQVPAAATTTTSPAGPVSQGNG